MWTAYGSFWSTLTALSLRPKGPVCPAARAPAATRPIQPFRRPAPHLYLLHMSFDEWEARERALADVHETLVSAGVLMPVSRGRAEEHHWVQCELASFAENRLGEVADPLDLDRSTRERWAATVLEGPLRFPRQRKLERCYWIAPGGDVAGTLALSRVCLGTGVSAHSVYLRPACRGAGVMARTLRAVRESLERHGLGLILETPWTWQPAVRFYLRNGFWLRSWKRDLAFVSRPHSPAPRLDVGVREASLSVDSDGMTIVLARARREGHRLVWSDEKLILAGELGPDEIPARTTLALAMAVAGWPLIRSERHWHQHRWSDLVHPEALACRIQAWEAWAAERGWSVDTPRIPGLTYPALSELIT